MSTKLQFVRYPLEGIAENKDAQRQLKKFHKLFKRGAVVPESVKTQADAMFAAKARVSMAGSMYRLPANEVLTREPHLGLAFASFFRDDNSAFNGIEFVDVDQEETADDAN
jgi:hypothetical protein